ncbi:MAG: DUF2177 family protein [Bacteroidota bacterium]
MKTVWLFLLTLLIYGILDLAFIAFFAKNFIQKQVGWLLAPKPDLVAAVIFYLIFVGGILYFCVFPAQTASRALLNGVFFGLVTYGTYELVNKSLLDRWPAAMVVVDLIWGVFVGGAVSWVSYKLGEVFKWI